MIFSECDSQLPMKLVLDRPAARDRHCKIFAENFLPRM